MMRDWTVSRAPQVLRRLGARSASAARPHAQTGGGSTLARHGRRRARRTPARPLFARRRAAHGPRGHAALQLGARDAHEATVQNSTLNERAVHFAHPLQNSHYFQ